MAAAVDYASLYPPIEPSNFDLILIGTGLPESLISAAASTNSKSVLHLDHNAFYGSHQSSLSLPDLISFLQSTQPQPLPSDRPHSDDPNLTALPLTTLPLYSNLTISSYSDEVLSNKNKFCLDVSGPRVLFCADVAVDLLLKSRANKYVEFKNVDSSWFWDGDGVLRSVPESRSGVFKDRSLGLREKNQLNSFFKLVQGHLEGEKRISEDDLERPFAEFLSKLQLPPKIKSIILYAIAMADYDQDCPEVCKDVLKTKDGIERLVLYHSSLGRFTNALGALIYPIYGQGELSQAFCRRAAVKGCIHVLRMPVTALLMDKDSGNYKGVKLASGQELFSHQLVMDPSFSVQSPLANSPSDFLQDSSNVFSLRDVKGKLARGICITKGSLKPEASNCVVSFPPRCKIDAKFHLCHLLKFKIVPRLTFICLALYHDQVNTVRVLQLGSNIAVCPSGMFVSYLCASCEDANEGKKSLTAAINALFLVHTSGSTENNSTDPSENVEVKPSLLWSALYIQELAEGSFGPVSFSATPDGSLNHNSLLDATLKLYQKLYPDEELFPETASSDQLEDEGEVD